MFPRGSIIKMIGWHAFQTINLSICDVEDLWPIETRASLLDATCDSPLQVFHERAERRGIAYIAQVRSIF